MKRADHLPRIHAGDWLGDGFKVTCACGDSWKRGDKYEDVTSTGKPILREVRGLKDARHAQRVHYETL